MKFWMQVFGSGKAAFSPQNPGGVVLPMESEWSDVQEYGEG